MRTTLILALVVCSISAGCADKKDASKSNFKTAIQAFLDTSPGLCFTPPATSIPFTLQAGPELSFGGGPGMKVRADALVEAGLLKRQDATVKGMFGAATAGFEYSTTDLGEKLLVKGAGKNLATSDAFCAGKYKVVEVTNFTAPADTMGLKISQVDYRYVVEGAPPWAKSDALSKAFPTAAKDLQSDPSARAVVVLTNEGWLHEKLFKRQ